MERDKIKKLSILAMMIAVDVVLSPLFRIEGMAPMSSVVNVIAATFMGPLYTVLMALICGIIRMLVLSIPPLALTGAVFGAALASWLYAYYPKVWGAIMGEIIGTGLIGSLLSYPVMVWFTGSTNGLFWLVYTPRFFGGSISGSIIAFLVLIKLSKVPIYQQLQKLFKNSKKEEG